MHCMDGRLILCCRGMSYLLFLLFDQVSLSLKGDIIVLLELARNPT